MDASFWSEQARWPFDPKGCVFLGRAMEKIGRSLYGNAWTGKECVTPRPVVLGPEISAQPWETALARKILHKFRPKLKVAVDPPGKYIPKLPLTRKEWHIARTISRKLYEEALPSVGRWEVAQSTVARLCAEGVVSSVYRLVKGGGVQPIPAEWWNTENYSSRFDQCQFAPQNPFGYGYNGEQRAWIFLTTESLDRWIHSQPNQAPPPGFSGHLSPYLRLMLLVGQKLQITAENQPKKEVVIAELRKYWTDKPLSNKLIETMATLLREPESQLGRARPKKKLDQKGRMG